MTTATLLLEPAIGLTWGKVPLVDLLDSDRLRRHKWHAVEPKAGAWYAQRADGSYMHLQVPGICENLADRPNRKGLDNGRARLRAATYSVSNCNARKRRGGTSRYKSVDWHAGARRASAIPPQQTVGLVAPGPCSPYDSRAWPRTCYSPYGSR